MRIGVICPHCGHLNTFSVEGYSMQIGICDDAGCGKYFAYRVRKVTTEVYTLAYCDMTQHGPNMGKPPGIPSKNEFSK